MYEIYSLLNSDVKPRHLSIEVSLTFQIPSFHIIGLPAPEINESKDRIRAAIEKSGFEFPNRRIVINLSPASIHKQGTGLDLAVALALLLETHQKEKTKTPIIKIFALGELGLDGQIKPVGQVHRALFAAKQAQADLLFLHPDDMGKIKKELKLLDLNSPSIFAIRHLKEAIETCLMRPDERKPQPSIKQTAEQPREPSSFLLPLSSELERVLAVTTSGRHHLLLLGPKGTGKTHSLEWLNYLSPPPSPEIELEKFFLQELSGAENKTPYRRIGAQTRMNALVGSIIGKRLEPGEFSLAHGGLLLADEFPEWSRDSREALREPLERGSITLTRAQGRYELPAQFQLAANGNLCPCGGKKCRCKLIDRERYIQKLSGPVLDRIDIVYILNNIPKVDSAHSSTPQELKKRVEICNQTLMLRYGMLPGQMSGLHLEALLKKRNILKLLLEKIPTQSLRDRHKVLRIALTLEAWDNDTNVNLRHFLEARWMRGRLPLDEHALNDETPETGTIVTDEHPSL